MTVFRSETQNPANREVIEIPLNELTIIWFKPTGEICSMDEIETGCHFQVRGPGIDDPARVHEVILPKLDYGSGDIPLVQIVLFTREFMGKEYNTIY